QSDDLNNSLLQITDIQIFNNQDMLFINRVTLQHLEIFKCFERIEETIMPNSMSDPVSSLFKIINHCVTTQGKAELRKWMHFPLRNNRSIKQRLDAVEFLLEYKGGEVLTIIRSILRKTGNMQKIILRIQALSDLSSDWKLIIQTLDSLKKLIDFCGMYQEKLYPVRELLRENFDRRLLENLRSWIIHVVETERTRRQQKFAIRSGVDPTLDQWNETYTCLPDLLSHLAEGQITELRANIRTCGLVYFPMVGYLLKIPKVEVETPDIHISCLEFAFTETKIAYYRNDTTRTLDRRYGDVMYSIVDTETTIMRHL
ncbi:unnamed protein product, partial [Trichobilharzia szidati]